MKVQFPDYTLDGSGSPSRYRHYEQGRGLNYYEADPNLRAVLGQHIDRATMQWADARLRVLGERCGTAIVQRADAYDRVGHELVRYDQFGRDLSRIAYHPDWPLNLNEVFDFGLVGWNYERDPAVPPRARADHVAHRVRLPRWPGRHGALLPDRTRSWRGCRP